MDAFEDLAFAGLQPDQRSILWVRHSHEDRIELHFVTPRMELSTGRSLNIAPPGYQKPYDALRDVLNKEHAWNDPQAPERAREVKSLIESVKRGEGREQIHDWIMDRIEAGEIRDRAGMIEQLTKAGFDIPRSGKNYITALHPESNERWRFKGDIFCEDWTRKDTLERAVERTSREPSPSGSRLDAISIEDLRERLHDITERRATYNRERYPIADEVEPPDASERPSDHGDRLTHMLDRHSDGFRSELVLGKHHDRQGAQRQPLATRLDYPSNQQRNGAEHGREPLEADRMSYWKRVREMFANLGKGIIDDRIRTLADSTRTRIDSIRRKIDRSFRTISNSIQGIRGAIEDEQRGALPINRKLDLVRDGISNAFNNERWRAGYEYRSEHSKAVEREREGAHASRGTNSHEKLTSRALQTRKVKVQDYSR